MSDKIREMFESGTQWEGSCAKYADGDYVNEVQQEQWIGFKDGYTAATSDAKAENEALKAENALLRKLHDDASMAAFRATTAMLNNRCKSCSDAKALVGELVEALHNLREWPETVDYHVQADKALTEATAWLSKEGE